MLPTKPDPMPKDWVRRVIREYCSYRIEYPYLNSKGELCMLQCASGIIWPKLIATVQKNCPEVEYSQIINIFENCAGREHSRLMLVIYGALKEAAIREGGLWVGDTEKYVWVASDTKLKSNRKRGANIKRKYTSG